MFLKQVYTTVFAAVKFFNPATWNPSAPAGGGNRRDPREVALL
jgi:hypothetical protein